MRILLLLLLASQQLTWYERYERGERLFNKGDYQACLDDMQAALTEEPKPLKNHITRAVQKINYKPFYYMALAHFELGQIAAAIRCAELSVDGAVVGVDPELRADLVKIYDRHRDDSMRGSQQYQREQEIIAERRQLISLLRENKLEEVANRLSLHKSEPAFDDLRMLLEANEDLHSQRSAIDTETADKIAAFIENGDKAGATQFLQAFRNNLPARTVLDLDERIKAMVDLEQVIQDETPVIDGNQEIDQLKSKYLALENENIDLKTKNAVTERKNYNLEQQLLRKSDDANEETTPIAFSPSMLLRVSHEGLRDLLVNARVVSPLPLVEWNLKHNGQVLNIPQGIIEQDGTNYALKYRFRTSSFGTHEVSLGVVDELKGPEVSEQQTVFLKTPLYLDTRLWWASACLFLLGLFAWFTRRMRKRKIARLRHFNPYIAGNPVRVVDMFFGRDQLIARIQGLVHKNSFMIHGERRIGKTSLLLQLRKNLIALEPEEYRFFPVFIDLQGTVEADLFHHMMSDVLASAADWGISLDELRYKEENDKYLSRFFSRDMKTLINRLNEHYAQHIMVVLLMDEVDVLNEFGEKTNQKLRGIFMKDFAEHLTCVMAGIHLKKEWESSGSPWYNFFEEIPVNPIDKKAARALVADPVKGIFTYRGNAVDLIINATAGHPYLIQKVCVSLIGEKLNANHFSINKTDVAKILDKLTEEIKRNHHEFYR